MISAQYLFCAEIYFLYLILFNQVVMENHCGIELNQPCPSFLIFSNWHFDGGGYGGDSGSGGGDGGDGGDGLVMACTYMWVKAIFHQFHARI